ncbi:potassium channel family protein [Paraburkholderia sp. GAS199]|uniref:potassium channel family protein n=1 Tax=Paraburkholderia sp. GAS199 TaxID=3035126 RepID=UPI003D218544
MGAVCICSVLFYLVLAAEVSDEEIPYQDGAFCALYAVIFLFILSYYSFCWWMLGSYGSKQCGVESFCDIKEAFYFSVATSTTLGYGDLAPTTDASRVFTCIQALTSSFFAILAFSLLLTKRRTAGTISHVFFRLTTPSNGTKNTMLAKIKKVPLDEWPAVAKEMKSRRQKFEYSLNQGVTKSWLDG